MNLSTVGAGPRTVEAFASEIKEEADPASHCYNSHPCHRASADANHEEAPVTLLDHRHVNRPHSSVSVVSQYTYPAHDAPRWASGARHPEPVSAFIHTV
jgi:hypothetical protein